jgi:hypothetical protein
MAPVAINGPGRASCVPFPGLLRLPPAAYFPRNRGAPIRLRNAQYFRKLAQGAAARARRPLQIGLAYKLARAFSIHARLNCLRPAGQITDSFDLPGADRLELHLEGGKCHRNSLSAQ